MKKYLILIILAFVFSYNQNLEIENNVNTWVVEQTETEKFHANMKVTKTGWASFWEIEELRWIFEEILIRFGLMTLLAWIFYKIFEKKNIWIFGSAIIISSIIFGVGHLPVMKLLVWDLTTIIIFYTIFGNFIPGLIFGFLYYKNGLEWAMITHIILLNFT